MSEEKAAIEAALFLAGRPLGAQEVADAAGVPRDRVPALLDALARDYRRRRSALEVTRVGGRWVLQVREEVAPRVAALARPELPADVLRTAALIAYHQPVRQSDLVAMAGPRVYEHVTLLARLRLIRASAEGNTLRLTTSPRFPEYFGLPARTPGQVKRLLAERVARGATPDGSLSPSHN